MKPESTKNPADISANNKELVLYNGKPSLDCIACNFEVRLTVLSSMINVFRTGVISVNGINGMCRTCFLLNPTGQEFLLGFLGFLITHSDKKIAAITTGGTKVLITATTIAFCTLLSNIEYTASISPWLCSHIICSKTWVLNT